MAMFVHLADARDARAIGRAGILPGSSRDAALAGVYAMPVLPNYFAAHQWLRELKRGGRRTMIGVHFRVPDREAVLVGHYHAEHRSMSAARAVRLIMGVADARGYQVIVPRKIPPRDIHAIRGVNRVVGWRYYPDAHGKRVCDCPVCLPGGSFKSRRLRGGRTS
jgi:hypothetical protein